MRMTQLSVPSVARGKCRLLTLAPTPPPTPAPTPSLSSLLVTRPQIWRLRSRLAEQPRASCPSPRASPLSAFPRSTQEGDESAPLSIVENGPQPAPRAMLEPDWTTCRKIRWAAAGLQERNAYFLMASIKIHVSPMPHYLECTARTTTCTVRGVALPTGRPRVRVLLLAAMKVPRSARAPVIFRDINAPQQTSASTYLGSEIVDDTRSVTRSPITRSTTLMA